MKASEARELADKYNAVCEAERYAAAQRWAEEVSEKELRPQALIGQYDKIVDVPKQLTFQLAVNALEELGYIVQSDGHDKCHVRWKK